MKKLFLVLGLSLVSCLSANQYVGIHAGSDYCHRTDENDRGQKVGYKFGGSYGYKFDSGLRAEVEIAYREGQKRTRYVFSESDDQRTHASYHSMSYMVNCLYDVDQLNTFGITPYIGAGIGLSEISYELKTEKGDFTNRDKAREDRFAYQIIAGIKYPIAEKLDIASQYTYHIGQYHAKNHSFSAALVKSF